MNVLLNEANQRAVRWEPGKLWSLWDMLELKFGRLLELHEALIVEKGFFERAVHALASAPNRQLQVEPRQLQRLKDAVTEVAKIAADTKLASTKRAAERTVEALVNSHVGPLVDSAFFSMDEKSCRSAFNHLMDITSRIRDDCHDRLYYQMTPEGAELLREDAEHFGPEVAVAFQTANEDIAEAACCLAFERATACVFHVMRALEVAVQVVAAKIGATIIDQTGKGLPWGVIADNMKRKIDKLPKGSDEQIKWYRVQTALEAVNRAWRAPTAHPKQTYSLAEAQRVFSATRDFMQELAPLA